MRKLLTSHGARQGVLALVDQCLSSATTFATMLLLARTCTQDELGIYSLCFSLVLFACVLQERSLSTPYLAFVHDRNEQSAAKLLGSTFVHQSILSLFISLGLLAFFFYLLMSEGVTNMSVSVLVLCFTTPFFLLRDFVRTVSFTHLRIPSAIFVDALVIVLQIGGIGALAYGGVLTIPRAFAVIGAACGLAATLWLATQQQPFSICWGKVLRDWKLHWNYARWLVFGRLLGNGSRICMPWIVAWLLDRSAAGVLAACATVVGISWVFIRGMNNLMRPRSVRALNHGGTSVLVRELWLTGIVFTTFLGGMCLLYLVAGQWLLRVLYGPDFALAAPALVILGLNALATSLAMTSSNGLTALQRPKGNFLGEAATFVVTVSLAVPLALRFGITGAAGAILAGSLASAVVMTAVLFRELRNVEPVQQNAMQGKQARSS